MAFHVHDNQDKHMEFIHIKELGFKIEFLHNTAEGAGGCFDDDGDVSSITSWTLRCIVGT